MPTLTAPRCRTTRGAEASGAAVGALVFTTIGSTDPLDLRTWAGAVLAAPVFHGWAWPSLLILVPILALLYLSLDSPK